MASCVIPSCMRGESEVWPRAYFLHGCFGFYHGKVRERSRLAFLLFLRQANNAR